MKEASVANRKLNMLEMAQLSNSDSDEYSFDDEEGKEAEDEKEVDDEKKELNEQKAQLQELVKNAKKIRAPEDINDRRNKHSKKSSYLLDKLRGGHEIQTDKISYIMRAHELEPYLLKLQ